MRNTLIAIPSYGRANNTTRFCTAQHISSRYWPHTYYYVEPNQVEEYRLMLKGTGARIRTADRADMPKKWGSIMDLIIDECCSQCQHLIIMDDDLKLDVRPNLPQEPTAFEVMDDCWFNKMVEDLSDVTCSSTPLTSAQYRQFCQDKTSRYQHNQRISMIWSLDAEFFRRHPQFRFFRHSRLEFMSDYYFFLNLLLSGYPNLCINRYTKDDKPNAAGGEKEKRTLTVFNRAVHQFAEMFPGYVTIREKRGKGNWKDGMLGVTIAASRAYTNNSLNSAEE